MRHNHPSTALALVCAAALSWTAACGSESPDQPPPSVVQSVTARVKFKGNDRLQSDVARTLALEKGEVCNELGRYSCTHLVHKVALGGVAAYDQGLFEPLPGATVTSPMAVERVALSACITRVDRDLAGPDPVIFQGLAIAPDGTLASKDAIARIIDTLYRRALQRRATASEIEHLQALYDAVAQRGGDRPARDWAVLSCFAVMSTMEQLFY